MKVEHALDQDGVHGFHSTWMKSSKVMQVYCGQSELANIGSTAYTLTIFEDIVYCHELL